MFFTIHMFNFTEWYLKCIKMNDSNRLIKTNKWKMKTKKMKTAFKKNVDIITEVKKIPFSLPQVLRYFKLKRGIFF